MSIFSVFVFQTRPLSPIRLGEDKPVNADESESSVTGVITLLIDTIGCCIIP